MSTNGGRHSQRLSRASRQPGVIARGTVPARHLPPRDLGDSHEVSLAWVRRVEREIRARKWSYRRFAAEITKTGHKCSHSTIGKLLKRGDDGLPVLSTSHLVAPICKLLGIPRATTANPELTEDASAREVAMLTAFRVMTPEDQEHWIGLLSAYLKRR